MKKCKTGFRVALFLGALLLVSGSAFAKPTFRTKSSARANSESSNSSDETKSVTKKTETKNGTTVETTTETKTEKKNGATIVTVTETRIETKNGSTVKTVTETRTETKNGKTVETKTESRTETKTGDNSNSNSRSESKSESKSDKKSDRNSDKKSDTKTDKNSNKKTDSKSNSNSSTDTSKKKSDSSSNSPVVTSISSTVSASDFELSIIAEINLMRSNPKDYAEKYIKPQITSRSSSYWTSCVRDMSKITSLGEFSYAEGLYKMAKAHSSTQGQTRQTGHTRTNGESFSDAVDKYGRTYSSVGENISYGSETARDILIQLLVDDGVSSLGHRKNLLNKDYTCVGVSFDKHKEYRYMCVMDFASGWVDR